MYDTHMHSDFSIDTNILMEDMVEEAIKKNGKSICFTDHVDLETGQNKIDIVFRVDDYFKKIRQLQYSYKDKIQILSGAELGLQPNLIKRYEDFVDSGPFDFIIASVHQIRHMEIHNDFVYRYSAEEATEMYYKDMYESLNLFDDYDTIAHIDYIDRYFPEGEKVPPFEFYKKYIEEILKLIIDKGKSLELNTGGKRSGLNYFHPKKEILELYYDLGGRLITLASDAHKPEDIFYGFKEATLLLKEIGFEYSYIYKERKKYPIHLS